MNLKNYRNMLEKPWGQIMYKLIFTQLETIKDCQILDFGAGFGLTAQYLAAKNKVIAVEPNPELLFADTSQTFTKIQGSLDVLNNLADHSFDWILCHNVLEYIPQSDHPDYLKAFERLLKPSGKLSIIKHNQAGKVLHTVVFENNVPKAIELLDNTSYASDSFAQGNTYTTEDLLCKTTLKLENYRGIRSCYALQPNDFKTQDHWLDNLLLIEKRLSDQLPYKDIAFFQHLTLSHEEINHDRNLDA